VSNKNVHNTHISAELPDMHRSLMEIVSVINRPERDEYLLNLAGLTLERALFPLLVSIERLGPIGVVDLADRVGRDYTTVSRQVARLDELGLVERRASEKDRRVREALITPQGKTATDAIDAARNRMALEMFQNWSQNDFDELVRLLRMLAEGMCKAPNLPPQPNGRPLLVDKPL
jgi:DNA-binding MarR family transcriptional regulator